MQIRYPRLFEQGSIGKVKVKNRIVFAPISTNLAGVGGEVTEGMIEHYHRIAAGGVGLVIVENACVHFPDGRHGATQPRIDSDKFIPGLYHLAQAIHLAGAKACIELTHPGGVADPEVTGTQPIAPSPIPIGAGKITPRELTIDEIEELALSFGEAAFRAKRALFDMVEIQAGHGLLINQFLSPLTNRRTDEFGGSLDGRFRFLKMVIDRIKECTGEDLPISVRLGVEEFTEGGINLSEGREIAKRLERVGVDAIHVTLGKSGREKRLEPMPYPQGWRTYLAEKVGEEVDIPVITVGVIREPWFAEKILEEGKADFIALGRALIADPEWPRKALEGREASIRRCISCNECVRARHYEGLPIRCALNPTVGLSGSLTILRKADVRRKVLVVGAGPAGMEAARVCALRGHEVHLYEREEKPGGALNMASKIPGKEKLKWVVEYYIHELRRLGVHLRVGKAVDRTVVGVLKPDVVIVATGAEPIIPDIPGVDGERVIPAQDVLRGNIIIEGVRVVVIGGGLIGLETAEYLALKGNTVKVLKRYRTISKDIEPIYASYLLTKLEECKVDIMFGVRVMRIEPDRVIIKDDEGRIESIPYDWVVLARGLKPSRDILRELDGFDCEIYMIGDCLKPGRIYDAIFGGFVTARQI